MDGCGHGSGSLLGLIEYVMVRGGPPCERGGVLHVGRAAQSVRYAKDAELGRHPVQIPADTIEIGVCGPAGESAGHGILRICLRWQRLCVRVEEDGIDVWQVPKRVEKRHELGRRSAAYST